MLRGVAAALLATTALAGPAQAYVKAGTTVMPGVHNVLKGATVQDGMATGLSAAYSFRKVRDGYAGSAVKLRRTTGGTQDIGFTAAGDFDTAAAATFCAATTCFLDTWYDQSGLARHVTQANPAAQPAYLADCGNGRPCARSTVVQYLAGASVTPASGPASFSAVALVDASSGAACTFVQAGVQAFAANTANWLLYNGAALAAPAAVTGWHAGNGVINGASSVINIDGAETTGTVAPVATAGAILVAYREGSQNCSFAEMFWWDNYALTAAERTAVVNNQKSYYTPLPLDSFATPAAAYSMRRLKSSYSGPAIRLRRASDNAEADIGFLGFTGFTGAPIDVAAANAHCAATSCTVAVWYDQSGNNRHQPQGSVGDQPVYLAACNGTLPCLTTTANRHVIMAGTYTPATGKASFSAVAKTSAAMGCPFPVAASQSLGSNASGNVWVMWNGSAGLQGPATDGAWHAATGVIDGANSALKIDGAADVTGTVAPNATAGTFYIGYSGGSAATCSIPEVILWDNYALTGAERTTLVANQRSFWGF